jgi:hypothetical protein
VAVAVAEAEFFVVTSGLRSLIENAPLVYVGRSLGGETLRTEVWQDGSSVLFRVRVPARDVVVLSHGTATVAP